MDQTGDFQHTSSLAFEHQSRHWETHGRKVDQVALRCSDKNAIFGFRNHHSHYNGDSREVMTVVTYFLLVYSEKPANIQ